MVKLINLWRGEKGNNIFEEGKEKERRRWEEPGEDAFLEWQERKRRTGTGFSDTCAFM